jgi:plastocyanin
VIRDMRIGRLVRWGPRAVCVAVLVSVFALVSACGSSSRSTGGTGGSAAATAAGSMVDVKNFSFEPMALTVAVGTTVTWKFDDSAQHTVSADDKSFVSPPMRSGQTYTHRFTVAGTYKYICSIHQYMTGTIVVK